jgi:hypothetical protein
MLKFAALLLVGAVSGYFYGFSDAKSHKENVFTRVEQTIGGSSRGRVGVDADRQMDSLEKR